MLPLLAAISPNTAILLFTIGVALVAIELNRPGMILPGSAGLLLTLLAAASLAERHPSLPAVLWIVGMIALLILPIGSGRVSWVLAAALTVGLIFAVWHLLPAVPGPRISPWAAVSSGIILGGGTSVLTRIARRARQNKGLD